MKHIKEFFRGLFKQKNAQSLTQKELVTSFEKLMATDQIISITRVEPMPDDVMTLPIKKSYKIDEKLYSYREGDAAYNKYYPFTAEKLSLKTFTIRRTKPSKLVKNLLVMDTDLFFCPRCGKKADFEQDHGSAFKCGKCGLNRQSFDDALYIWN